MVNYFPRPPVYQRYPVDQNGGYGRDTIGDLLLGMGQTRAFGAQQSGQTWGNALAQAGAGLGSAIQQHAETQAMAKRDAAMVSFIEAWDGQDEKGLLSGMTKILGARDGPLMARTVKELTSKPKEDPKAELEGMRLAFDIASKQSDDVMARAYPAMRARWLPTLNRLGISEDMLPPEWTPELRQPIQTISGALTGDKKEAPVKLSPGESIVEGGKITLTAPFKPEAAAKAPDVGSFERYVTDKYGQTPTPQQVMSARSEWAAVAREPKAAEGASAAEMRGYLEGLQRGDISMSDVPAKDRSAVLAAAGGTGVDTRTAKQKEIDSAAQAVLTSLDQLEAQAKKTMTATTGPGAMVQGGMQRALNTVGLAEETRLWDAQLAKLAGFARQLGERGNLSEGDVERIQALLPKLTDPVTVRDKKLADVRQILEAGLRGKVSQRVDIGGKTFDSKTEAERLRSLYGQ